MDRKRYSLADYNKKEASVDATKFFIIYEGELKEPKYFEAFNNNFLNPKTACILHVFESDTKIVGSQPKKLIERAVEFIENPPTGLKVTPTLEDKFRFVLDVDDHPTAQFDELKDYCRSLPDANLYISNYCFEVWLYFHLDEQINMSCTSSSEMKTELGEKHTEHKLKNYPKSYLDIELINNAIDRADKVDVDKENYFPAEKSSKVYLLMKELLEYSIDNNKVKDPEIL
ncbi:RloB family protein [Flavobacterium sp. DG1-102-2]|uniref:RloB family protein n=1 Tax=Flavobacterium sp. DG1-102-2 TaxID=3081663 RepID=UPI00294997E4|nr:RloB family protein [Flavobacterium sp. DG1-102-2]MDV6167632.1 RloB family protein [Flavobacterium sp. DG1-102-2]